MRTCDLYDRVILYATTSQGYISNFHWFSSLHRQCITKRLGFVRDWGVDMGHARECLSGEVICPTWIAFLYSLWTRSPNLHLRSGGNKFGIVPHTFESGEQYVTRSTHTRERAEVFRIIVVVKRWFRVCWLLLLPSRTLSHGYSHFCTHVNQRQTLSWMLLILPFVQ